MVHRSQTRLTVVPEKFAWGVVLCFVGGLGACEPTAHAPPLDDAGVETDPDGVPPGDKSVLSLATTRSVGVDRFVTSTGCALCHSNHASATAMRDELDNEIAPFNLWRGTMMANASRDPLWRAAVSLELARTPSAKRTVEAKCMRCHAPMASEAARANFIEPTIADLHDDTRSLQQLSLDGVSCSVCHQIQPDQLGTEASYSGGFTIGNRRLIFGPHENPATAPMRNHVNYTPTYGPHVLQSNLCATCHNLATTPLDGDGNEVADVSFQEQATYWEWKNSEYNDEGGAESGRTCQSCHMATISESGVEIETRIARSPPGGDFLIDPRRPFGRHALVGANTLMPAILKNERDVLRPQATDAAFDETIAGALERLQESTATVEVVDVIQSDGVLRFAVNLLSKAGHKLPTGFPSRRLWVQALVYGEDDLLLFSSGRFNDQGRLIDQDGNILATEKPGGTWQPHHTLITQPNQVQIYEHVMGDDEGHVTISLLGATQSLKDNRMLPRGYQLSSAAAAKTTPVGVVEDSDFAAGQDTVRYEVALADELVRRVEVKVFYQTVGSRYVRELFQVDTPEIRAFRTMYEEVDVTPVEVTSAVVDL